MNRYLTFEIIKAENIRKIKYEKEVVYIEYYSELLKRIDSIRLDKEIIRFKNILEIFTNKFNTEFKDLDNNDYAWEQLADNLGIPEALAIDYDYADLKLAITVTKDSIITLESIHGQIQESIRNGMKKVKLKRQNGKIKSVQLILEEVNINLENDKTYAPNKKFTNQMFLEYEKFYNESPNQEMAYEKLVNLYPNKLHPLRYRSFVKMYNSRG